MARLNHHFSKLSPHYFFHRVAERVERIQKKNNSISFIDLSNNELALETGATEQAISDAEYKSIGICADEIFLAESAESSLANIQEIFALESKIALPNPSHPIYIDLNVMAGRTRLPLKTGGYGGVVYLPCTEENGFCPEVPNRDADLIYLASPGNPTGVAMSRESLKLWVAYAQRTGAILLFDGTFSAFIRSPGIPRSIYEIEGASEVAIEVRSRYMVIPRALTVVEAHQRFSLHALWSRRQQAKGIAVSAAACKQIAALYTKSGQEEARQTANAQLANAALMRDELIKMGHTVYGGSDSPLLWMKTPSGISSWDYFEILLEKGKIATVPGSGFGSEGEGYVCLSAQASEEILLEAIERIKKL